MVLFEAKQTMLIRSKPGGAKVGTLQKGTQFWSEIQETRPGGQEWAKHPQGWVCVKDSLSRYLVEIPQPAPLPAMPEPAGGLDLLSMIAALDMRVKVLEDSRNLP